MVRSVVKELPRTSLAAVKFSGTKTENGFHSLTNQTRRILHVNGKVTLWAQIWRW